MGFELSLKTFAFVYLLLALRVVPDAVRFTFYSVHHQYTVGPKETPWPVMFAVALVAHVFHGTLMVIPMLLTGRYWKWATNAECKKFVLDGHADVAAKNK